MHAGKLVFAQFLEFAPWHTFRRLVAKYQGNFNVWPFSCLNQFLCMAFAQLTYQESLRDIEACLRAQSEKFYHMGIRGNVIYALDSTTIDLCLSMFEWALFRQTKAAIKLHILLDLRGSIPTFIHISDGKLHDVNVLDLIEPELGAFYVMDRGYVDFKRLYKFVLAGSSFVTRVWSNFRCRKIKANPVGRSTGVLSDQVVELVGFYSRQHHPARLRRIRYRDRLLIFLTNKMTLPVMTGCDLYRLRWQVELFFKWIKQHLRIKRFFGTSENAVKTQVWIAVGTYVLVAIIRKRLNLSLSLHTMLQILSVTPFERVGHQ